MLVGGQLVAKMLKREGIEVVFTLCGGHIMSIYDGLLDEGIRIVDTRHEQAAVHAADAYARLTRRPGVAIVTAGVGVTDAVTGIANAYQADSPVLVIGGQAPSDQLEMGSLQELDSVTLVSSITKWARTVQHTHRIPEYLSIAFRHMLAGRYGPAFLEIPIDVLIGGIEESALWIPESYRTEVRSQGDSSAIQQAAVLLERAERPAVIAGGEIWWSNASDELSQFALATKIPVYLNGMARGALAPDHPSFFNTSRRYALANADVIVVLGAPLDFRLGYGKSPDFNSSAQIVQVSIDPREVGHNRGADVGIIGDVKSILKQLDSATRGRHNPGWLRMLQAEEVKERGRVHSLMISDSIPIHPLRLAKEIADVLDEDTIVIGDGGNIVSQASKLVPISKPGHWLDPGRFGCLGVGVPFAIAAKLVHPKSKVLIVHGDGAFGLNGVEFDTAVRHDLPIVSVIGNDAAWGQIRGPQIRLYGKDRAVASELRPSRYDLVVKDLGGYGECITDPSQLRGALERAFSCGKPACVNVLIDPEVNAAVSANSMVV